MVSTRSGRAGSASSNDVSKRSDKVPKAKQSAVLTHDLADDSNEYKPMTSPVSPRIPVPESTSSPHVTERKVLMSPRINRRIEPTPSATLSPGTIASQLLSQVPLPDDEEEEKRLDTELQRIAATATCPPASPPPTARPRQASPMRRDSPSKTQQEQAKPRRAGRSAVSWLCLALSATAVAALVHMAALLAVCSCLPSIGLRLPTPLLTHLQPVCQVSERTLLVVRHRAVDMFSKLHHANGFANSERGSVGGISPSLPPWAAAVLDTVTIKTASVYGRLHSLRHQRHQPAAAPAGMWSLVGNLLQAATGSESFADHEDEWQAATSQAESQHKALGTLLACADQARCDATAEQVAAVPEHANCPGAVVVIRLEDFLDADEGAGRLQRHLAEVLISRLCGAAIVALGLDSAPPALVSVFNNVLSEGGNLQLDGRPVPTRAAAFFFPVPLAAAIPDVEAEAAGVVGMLSNKDAKDELILRMTAVAATAAAPAGETESGEPIAGGGSQVQGLLRALRRRIDLVVHVA